VQHPEKMLRIAFVTPSFRYFFAERVAGTALVAGNTICGERLPKVGAPEKDQTQKERCKNNTMFFI
jgi:hypothetical protein